MESATMTPQNVRSALSLCVGVLAISCGVQQPLPVVQASDPKSISLVQLVANPAEWHGKLVRVIGFCHLEFEGDALYFHRDDFEQAISKNAVWLDVPEGRQALSDQYVLVEGVFDAESHGHLGAFSGVLKDVRRMERWPSRREFQEGPPRPRR